MIERLKLALWLKLKCVPVRVSEMVDAERYGAAVMVNVDDFPAAMSRLAGVIVTPDGNPVTAIPTAESKPLSAVTETVTVAEPLAATTTLEFDRDKLKSGGGGVCFPLPPQPQSIEAAISARTRAAQEKTEGPSKS